MEKRSGLWTSSTLAPLRFFLRQTARSRPKEPRKLSSGMGKWFNQTGSSGCESHHQMWCASYRLLSRFCSPRKRARQTLRLLGLGDEDELSPSSLTSSEIPSVRITELLREWDYGNYEGLTIEEVRKLRRSRNLDEVRPWNIWRDGCEGGEWVKLPLTYSHGPMGLKSSFDHLEMSQLDWIRWWENLSISLGQSQWCRGPAAHLRGTILFVWHMDIFSPRWHWDGPTNHCKAEWDCFLKRLEWGFYGKLSSFDLEFPRQSILTPSSFEHESFEEPAVLLGARAEWVDMSAI